MKRFFLVTIGLFVLGVGAPLMAASTGGEKKPVEKESVATYPDSMSQHPQQEEKKTISRQLSTSEILGIGVPVQNPIMAAEGKPKTIPAEAAQGQKLKKEEEATQNLSFNFLYYLFYKFHLNDFSSTPQYH